MSKYIWIGAIIMFLFVILATRSSAAPSANSAPLPPMTPEQLAEVERLALAGDKISAIKLYRKLTGVGLKEAKDAVEKLIG